MFPFITDQFKEVELLISQGNIDQALTHVEEYLLNIDKNNNQFKSIILLKIYLLLINNSAEEANHLADEIKIVVDKTNDPSLICDALILKAEALRSLGNFSGSEALRHPTIYMEILPVYLTEYKELIVTYEEQLRRISNKETLASKMQLAWLLSCKGIILITKKDFARASVTLNESLDLFKDVNYLEGVARVFKIIGSLNGVMGHIKDEIMYLEQSKEIYQDLNFKREVACLTLRIGILNYNYLSETKTGLELILNSLTEFESINDQQGITVALNFLGNLYTWLGELDRGLGFLQRSMFNSERLGNMENLALTLNNIGWNHHTRGELELALESLNRSLTLSREKQFPWILIWTLSNIGFVNQARSDFDAACGYYTQSINICDDINDYLACSWSLYHVIKLTLDTNSLTNTLSHISRLEKSSNLYQLALMSQMFRVSEALLLKKSNRLKDKVKAQELLEKVANEHVQALEVTSDAIINLCDILLFEYKISADTTVLKELEDLSDRFLIIAEEQNSHSLLSEGYLLKSEIALLLDDIPLAKRLIDQAQTIAEEKGLQKLAIAISREYDNILDQINAFDLETGYLETRGELEIEKVENLLDRMTTQNIAAVSKVIPEKPEMLLIITEGGMTLFTYHFKPKERIKSQLVGAFLSAIESFSKEIFSSSIERVNLGEFRLILHSHLFLTFAYVFKGESYSAIKKLGKLVSSLESSAEIWTSIQENVSTGKLLSNKETSDIIEFVVKIFPSVD
ncbi:MAG: tetratricopeptide repeat protein [Candidatus Hodarchaeales archaeon]|jgi:tetratricopeptide (TPR) repeat protein